MTVNDSELLPYVHQLTKYDPADRDERGRYIGPEDTDSDEGPVEAAYLEAVAAFAEDSQVTRLMIREPEAEVWVGLDGDERHGQLAMLFGPGLSGYHDGAQVPMAVGLELVRLMLRGGPGWCRLEAEEQFFIHVGWDQYVYIGSTNPCERAVALAHRQRLFAERIARSPYDPALTEYEGSRRTADSGFWEEVVAIAAERGAVLLEEGYVYNAARWHRITTSNVDAVRTRLTPRARLLVWPDLQTSVDAALASLPEEGLSDVVWQDHNGQLNYRCIDETDHAALRTRLTDAHAAIVLSTLMDERQPLLSAVLPDADGVLRSRWAA